MEYLISFLEGFITFISPCMLPMIPIYVIYFTGEETGKRKQSKTWINAIFFVLGFTMVFVTLGVFASFTGKFLVEHRTLINLITGIIVIVLGLNYLGVFKIGFLNRHSNNNNTKKVRITSFFSAFLFGIVFSVSWTPCVGTFLMSALIQASQSETVFKGVFLLLSYSLGLGIPFILSTILINQLTGAFNFIKSNYQKINKFSGIFLIIIGILMATGQMNKFLGLFS